MRAFINTPITKEKFLKHLKWHQEQDAFIKGDYHKDYKGQFKGCAVGCSIHSIQMELNGKGKEAYDYSNHKAYEEFLNVPSWLAKVEDRLFEGMPLERSKIWPVEFAEAIPVGANLDKIKIPFLVFVVESVLDKFDHHKYPDIKSIIDNVLIELRREVLDKQKLKADAAYAAADAAAADAAADAAAYADAAHAAAAHAAADAAADAAAYAAADAAYYAAYYAADAADAADAAYAADADAAADAADAAAYAAAADAADAAEKFANKLLSLMRNCPVDKSGTK